VQHRSEQRISDPVTEHIDQDNASHTLTAAQMFGNIGAASGDRRLDARRQIEPLFEIDVNEVIAADGPVQRQRPSEDIDTSETRKITRLWQQVLRDLLKVVQLARELPQ
jgi:hypothetical protein